ncbi:class I SAM-dependent methyltransferase [Litorisediminicola beolgyonensis]|uniref:Class I SAM-dependent methyltransferase n=1 Tax=Litorisediminicola beolgyonensis TaxID=1173614 RepID=A0ABW3ZFE4_9RHOB
MTPLHDLLLRRIRAEGPLTVAEYMATCLQHPQHGYYATRDPLGVSGDFVTAPEISQMFGELIGLALAQVWLDHGAPEAILVEFGPGRGTLMSDALRATRGVAGFHDRVSVHLIESSPVLRAAQAEQLAAFSPSWHDGISTLPERPIFFVANEFFDALPIRQFLRDDHGWRERLIGAERDRLVFGLTDPLPRADLDHRWAETQPGDLVETCAPATAIASEIGARLATQGGAGLVIDYGSDRSLGDTFQAVRQHLKTDPLDTPGEADLTAHVDFGALAAAAGGNSALTPQGVFLERLGITARAQSLARGLSGPALDSHIAAHRRLTHPDEMGSLFKILGLASATGPLPPGFLE